jgi:6-pyruvoyltetrahydropterin/6-carboxytetrahydropterin synthase
MVFALILDQAGSKADMPGVEKTLFPRHLTPMIEISQEFGFDAAHYLGNGAHQNRRLHGHSFYAEVTLRGEPNPATGFLRDFGEVDAALKVIRQTLDHRLLNEIEELGVPTLENLARYIYVHAKKALPEVARVKLRRPSYGQTCIYEE